MTKQILTIIWLSCACGIATGCVFQLVALALSGGPHAVEWNGEDEKEKE